MTKPRIRVKAGSYAIGPKEVAAWQILNREPDFDGGSSQRLVRDWSPGVSSPNSHITGGFDLTRKRSRDLARKVPLIAGTYDSLVANLVGPGIRPMPSPPTESLRDKIKDVWGEWILECDADGMHHWDSFVALAVRSWLESGEVFIRRRPRRSTDGMLVPLQLQMIESEHVPAEENRALPNGNKIVGGIEFDPAGRRVAYHMYAEHPAGDGYRSSGLVLKRIPAKQIIHFFDPIRPGQVRGLPKAFPALLKARDWLLYDEAELQRKQMAAMYVGFVTTPDPSDTPPSDPDDEEDEEGIAIAPLESGTLQVLGPGQDIRFSAPADVGQQYDAFVKTVLRSIAAAFGLTYEQLTGDLSDVSFSSIRAGLNEFQRRARKVQADIIHRLCRPVYRWFLDEAVFHGVIQAPGYATDPRPYRRARWIPPGWRYVNPKDEIEAEVLAIANRLTSRDRVIAERGYDPAEIDREIAEAGRRPDPGEEEPTE